MNLKVCVAFGITMLALGTAYAAKVHDWKDLDRVHNNVKAAIKDMDRARAANHFDMDGHGVKAADLLHDAERELDAAVKSAKNAK